VLQIAPPLICDAAVLDEIVDRLHDVLADAGRFMDLVGAPAAVA
jgi:acetylornithine/succinyldiaminopimelate/putrescine aminotransferase